MSRKGGPSYIALNISLSAGPEGGPRRRFRRGLQNVLIKIYDSFIREGKDE